MFGGFERQREAENYRYDVKPDWLILFPLVDLREMSKRIKSIACEAHKQKQMSINESNGIYSRETSPIYHLKPVSQLCSLIVRFAIPVPG